MKLSRVPPGSVAFVTALSLLAPAPVLPASARPPAGVRAPAAAAPAAAAAAAPGALPAYTAADWKRIDPANLLVIDTTKGRVIVELVPEVAPAHAARIKELAGQGYYDGLKFFRVIDDF